MPADRFIAFDLGAESGRAVVGSLDRGKLALLETHRFANPSGRICGHLHWNLLAQWEELKLGLRKSCAGTDSIRSLGIDTWGVDFGLIGQRETVLGNPFMYRDSRTDGMMERAFQRVPRSEIFELTGIQFMQFNTLFQLCAMAWEGSPQLKIAEKLLFIPDLFNFLFTGVVSSEFSIATTSQMYDPRTGTWATDLLKRLDLPIGILPEIVPSATVLGALRPEIAGECGAPGIPVVAPGCHDTASAVAAVPSTDQSSCYISSGTWSLMGVEVDRPIINEKVLKYNYTNEGGVAGNIRLLKNIMGLWLVQECRRAFLADGNDLDYAKLTSLADQAEQHVAVVDPDHAPFLSPGQMPQKISEFCTRTGQRNPQSPGEYVRVCLESLALTYRRTLLALEDILGRRIETIHIVGGGSRNELLNQMTADACNRPVIAGPVEATAIGNILVQAIGVGVLRSLAEARQIVRNSFPVKRYEPQPSPAWDQAADRFTQLVT
jgi:rhamnulokinase